MRIEDDVAKLEVLTNGFSDKELRNRLLLLIAAVLIKGFKLENEITD